MYIRAKAVLGCVLMIVLVSCSGVVTTPGPTPTPEPSTDVKIDSPNDGAEVNQTEEVTGSSKFIAEGSKIWIIVKANERYYPQNNAALVMANGDWAATTYIGEENDAGMEFTLYVVVADQGAQNVINEYLEDAADREDWAGLLSIPEGALPYDKATVTRK